MKITILCIAMILTMGWGQMPWPHPPQDQVHPLGNSWGIYQDYGGSPYVHNGADIMTTPLCPVTVIKYGFVKQVWLYGGTQCGIVVGDSANASTCFGYQYYHVDQTTIQVQVGDTVYVGDTIARIYTWPVYGFHHNHFSKNRNAGVVWNSWGVYIRNPLTEFQPDNDSMVPVFNNAVSGRIFAICRNNSSSYQNPDSIYGDVDFICRVEDKVNHRTWWVAVYKLIYSIRDTVGNYVVPPKLAVQFSDSLESYVAGQVRTVYKDDGTCNSNCNYDSLARRLYHIFTNTDGDSTIESTDSLQCWSTTTVPNGPYWVKVVASDEYGNSVAESMLVRVKNPGAVEEGKDSGFGYGEIMAGWPNPARGNVCLRIMKNDLPDLNLAIYDVAGKLVRVFEEKNIRTFPKDIVWDRLDQEGKKAPAGCYFVRLVGRPDKDDIKITLID